MRRSGPPADSRHCRRHPAAQRVDGVGCCDADGVGDTNLGGSAFRYLGAQLHDPGRVDRAFEGTAEAHRQSDVHDAAGVASGRGYAFEVGQ